jgi:hypothetical protein
MRMFTGGLECCRTLLSAAFTKRLRVVITRKLVTLTMPDYVMKITTSWSYGMWICPRWSPLPTPRLEPERAEREAKRELLEQGRNVDEPFRDDQCEKS